MAMKLARGTREVFDAETLLEEYVGPRQRRSRYPYPYYDGLVTNGDLRTLCTGDLLAPTLLSVAIDLDRFHTLTELLPGLQRGLDMLPVDVALADADDALCDAVADLWQPLDTAADTEDIKGSLVAKVLHRKRPALIPLFDSRVYRFYVSDEAVPPPQRRGERDWREYMALLTRVMRQDLQEHRDEFDRLSRDVVPADGPSLTPLRILDIVVWMSSGLV